MTPIDIEGSGQFILVDATDGMRIRITQMVLTTLADGIIKFFSSGGTQELIAGPFYLQKSTALVLPWVANGWIETATGEALIIEVDAGTVVGGVFSFGVVQ